MKAVGNNIFVKISKKYKDEIVFANGKKLYLDPSYDKFKHRTVDGIVTSVPPHLEDVFQEGDRVWYHHSIIWNKDNEIDSENNIFKVQYDRGDTFDCLVYLIERGGKRWTTNHYVFLDPIKPTIEEKVGSIYIPKMTEEKDFSAVVAYCNDRLPNECDGCNVGDTIVFAKNSEYVLNIDGKDLYRTRLENILATI